MIRTEILNTDGQNPEYGGSLAVHTVTLDGFRNYENETAILARGFNILAGKNAQGKTNFLEAVYLISSTRLLRGQRDGEAIREGQSKALVMVELADSETKLGMTLEAGVRKRAAINGLSMPRASDLIGRLPCVCVSALDMAIVRGEPSDRRLFLDLELSALYPAYLRHLTLYKRALEQRNALLRHSREWMQPAELFEPWEEQLATHGIALRNARAQFVERLSESTGVTHGQIGSGESIRLLMELKDDASTSEELLKGLAFGRATDIARGGTGVGPHRDDLRIDVSSKDARLYGSQGQQRTAVISMKLACLEIARQTLGLSPLLLLDDILSDLDESRRSLLIEVVLERAGQAILTCTEASAAGSKVVSLAKVFHVDSGRVTEA